MKILFITDPYPNLYNPNNGVFVYNLVQQLCNLGHEVTVISNTKVNYLLNKKYTSYGEEKAITYFPKFISLSAKKIGNFNTYSFTRNQKVRSVKRIVKNEHIEFDFVYCHFVQSAFIAVEALSDYGKPIITAVGESNGFNYLKNWYGAEDFQILFKNITAFIAVSKYLKDELLSHGVSENNILVEPNGTDLNRFFKRDKNEMREKYDLPKDKFIGIFVGNFINRKGPHRVLEAINEIDDAYMIYIGEGYKNPAGGRVLLNKKVPNHEIPELLSAADVFVLPTLKEGACNAIIEAMACGLPIISSDIPEIKIQCTPHFSLLVDPLNIQQIKEALIKIKKNPNKAKEMSDNALKHAKNFDLSKRAERIMKFVNRIVD